MPENAADASKIRVLMQIQPHIMMEHGGNPSWKLIHAKHDERAALALDRKVEITPDERVPVMPAPDEQARLERQKLTKITARYMDLKLALVEVEKRTRL